MGSSGLSGGPIAAIVIAWVVAIIIALVIYFMANSLWKPSVDQTVTAPIENSNEIGNSVGQFKAMI